MEKINIFWHRRDFRYKDNVGLYHALKGGFPVLPVFIFDTNILDDLEDKKDARVEFILSCVNDIDCVYRNLLSGLLVLHGTPEEAFHELKDKFRINAVYTNRDYEPYAKQRDKKIEKLLSANGIGFLTFKDQVIFEEGEILNNAGAPYKVFTPYKKAWLDKFETEDVRPFKSELRLESLFKIDVPNPPTLEHLGFKKSKIKPPQLQIRERTLKEYEEKRDLPAEEGTTRLGVHLRFGTIGIREAVNAGKRYSGLWLNELIWREFYMMILSHFPNVEEESFKSGYDRIQWENDEENFRKWCEGKTGYPFVDAGMRELNATGYMHNRARMVTASFLTKHLLIDWRWGERYFAQKLLDYELASNNGGWQWAAGTGTDAQPYFRVFNPYSQQGKFDKDFRYIKKWIPEYGSLEYPDPIVIHEEARKRAIETYKKAIS